MKKETLHAIAACTDPALSDLATAIKGLTEMVDEYKKECQANSVKIVELKVELELIKNENREIKEDFASRINMLEQRSRINNLEVVGLDKPTELETDTKLTLDFLKEAMKANVDGAKRFGCVARSAIQKERWQTGNRCCLEAQKQA